MTKLYENTFRAVNIALSLEMADACVHYGLDPVEVTDAAASKPYAFMAHYPSAGMGGHCIGVEPYYLLRPLGEQQEGAPMTEKALELVSGPPRRVPKRAPDVLGEPAGARMLIVGTSYKPGVADMREAPAMKLIVELARAGAEVCYYDPLIRALEADGRYYEHTLEPDPGAYGLVVLAAIQPGRVRLAQRTASEYSTAPTAPEPDARATSSLHAPKVSQRELAGNKVTTAPVSAAGPAFYQGCVPGR